MLTLLNRIAHWPVWQRVLLVGLLLALVGVLDVVTGYELAFSLFYVIPVSVMSWTMGRRWGLGCALLSGVVWFYADEWSGHVYAIPLIAYWNVLIRTGFFLLISSLLSSIKTLMEKEQRLSRYDSLTGVMNSRYFFEQAEAALAEHRRLQQPFVLAYLDMDHFKQVNDQHGHAEGDRVLREATEYLSQHLRAQDLLGRMGGDEFTVLLACCSADEGKVILGRLQHGLNQAMQQRGWPVTLSVGMLHCTPQAPELQDLLTQADQLMYAVKRDGRNGMAVAGAVV